MDNSPMPMSYPFGKKITRKLGPIFNKTKKKPLRIPLNVLKLNGRIITLNSQPITQGVE
jgi:hypothetical protein